MRCSYHTDLCVLRISSSVLRLPGVIIADGNAASDYTSFWASPSGLAKVDKDTVFAEWWTDPNQFVAWEIKELNAPRYWCRRSWMLDLS
jgi:ssDNA thymidine ADP-ribosyltransferase, DarT